MTIKIDPAVVTLSLSGGGNGGSIHFETGEARYHVWVILEPLSVREDGAGRATLYKNPPLGLGRHDEGWFSTRYLNLKAAANRPVIERLFEIVRERDLIAKAREEAEKAARIAELRTEERRRLHAQRDLGPQLLDAVRELFRATEGRDAAGISAAWSRIGEIERLAEAPREAGRWFEVRDRRKPETAPSRIHALNRRAAIEGAVLGRCQGIVLDDVLAEDIEVVRELPAD